MNAIFYVLRTGCQWNALPRSLGASSTVHDRFQEWRKGGVFERMWKEALFEYDEKRGLSGSGKPWTERFASDNLFRWREPSATEASMVFDRAVIRCLLDAISDRSFRRSPLAMLNSSSGIPSFVATA